MNSSAAQKLDFFETFWSFFDFFLKFWEVLGLFSECFGTFLEHFWTCLDIWGNYGEIFFTPISEPFGSAIIDVTLQCVVGNFLDIF